jgi:ATP-binding cassette subfamily B protein
MKKRSLNKYAMVYRQLWRTYGSSGQVRLSFFMQLFTRMGKLIVLPIAISLIVSRLSVKDYDGAYQAVALFVGCSLFIGVITPIAKYIGMMGENKVYKSSTATYFGKLVAADLDYFHSNLAGYLTAATRQYVDSSVQLIRGMRDRYMNTLLSIIFPIGVILWVDIWLGLVALGLCVVQAVYLLWASNIIAPHRTLSREIYKRNSGLMADVISNILAVRSTAQEAAYTARIGEGAERESAVFSRRYAIQSRLIGVREVLTVSFFMVLLWLTVQRMSNGLIDITAAVIVVTYMTTILGGIYMLSENLDEHDDFIDKIIPAFDILNRQNVVNDPAKPIALKGITGDIHFDNVSFAYSDTGQPVFRNFSLHIPAGQKIGIVGLSGAGKSTLAKLLLRFNDVDAGHIRIDGTDIRSVTQVDLRQHIGYVPQEPLLFHASIRDNIVLANTQASERDITTALQAAHALHFIERLPGGLDSIVGEHGVKLSGGQKQRVAIARTVLRQTPIMVLDEATSALDSESEQIIKASFSEILAGKTAVVIAHRLSTLSQMDRIVVIEKGECVEDGTHDELLALNGRYARLWQRQQNALEVE